MKLLLLDTCGPAGSVALAEGATVIAEELLPGRSSSERLVPAVRRLLEGSGWRLAELDAVVVVRGPGSFTGIRVGLSAAKGLSEAIGVRLMGLSRLAVLAWSSGVERVALDAGRGEFFYAEYREGTVMEAHRTREELAGAVGSDEVAVCETRVAEALAGVARVRLVAELRATAALPLAVSCFRAGAFDDAGMLDANYVNRADGLLYAKMMAAR